MMKLLTVFLTLVALACGRPQFIGFLPQFQTGAQPLTFTFPFGTAPPAATPPPTTTTTTPAPTTAAPAPTPAQIFFPFGQFGQPFAQFAQPVAIPTQVPIRYSFNTGRK